MYVCMYSNWQKFGNFPTSILPNISKESKLRRKLDKPALMKSDITKMSDTLDARVTQKVSFN